MPQFPGSNFPSQLLQLERGGEGPGVARADLREGKAGIKRDV